MADIDPQEFGRLQAQVEHLSRTVESMQNDVKELLAAVANARGGWKTLLMVGGAAGAMGGLLTKAAHLLAAAPK